MFSRPQRYRSTDPLAVNPAKYRHRIEIQSQGPTSPPTYNAAGQVQAWSTFIFAAAAIEPLRAEDVVRSGQTVTQTEIPIKIRYRPGVTSNMRVLFTATGAVYVIRGIINTQERNRELILMCLALGDTQ